MKKFILVMLLFMFSIISFGNENQFMKEIFERKGLNGTFVVYDLKNDKIDYYNLDRANERFYPASSFKIFNLTGKKSPTSIGGAMNCPIVF